MVHYFSHLALACTRLFKICWKRSLCLIYVATLTVIFYLYSVIHTRDIGSFVGNNWFTVLLQTSIFDMKQNIIVVSNVSLLRAESNVSLSLSSQQAIGDVHVKGLMYRAVEADIGNDKYRALCSLICVALCEQVFACVMRGTSGSLP